eukprot:CAMPEP_0113466716 /NCGR_PEP_ID=MMETSP0014_2-20120614/14423_1 /TAXON_ID=2857 /ORGANISM="Nitzschia sp." /LENGTH=281 /DNA_ID=CAMNT_0000358963 /DNA_START=49 /DNA_END=894 /DNA_ORIENTATION=+ /assembly_acc=CAM_ASM_000159
MVYKPFIDFLEAEKKALASARQKQKLLDQSLSKKNNITNVVVRPQQQQQQQQKNKKGNSDLSTSATKTKTMQANSASNFASQAAKGRQKKNAVDGDHPAKNKTVHPKDMTDKEKIGALKNEIDNLRSQVWDTNTIGDARTNPYQSTSGSSTSSTASAALASKGSSQHAMFNLTMLSLTVLVVVAIMARLKRRASSSSSSSRPSAAFMRMVSVASLSTTNSTDDPELGRNFELRPQPDLHVDGPEITLTDNNNNGNTSAPAPSSTDVASGYVAPDAADVRLV